MSLGQLEDQPLVPAKAGTQLPFSGFPLEFTLGRAVGATREGE
jgi:hypothetical protein